MTILIDSAYLINTLENLIRIDSTNPSLLSYGAGEMAIANYIADEMEALGLEITRYEPEPERVSVVARLPGTGGGRSLMLNGHVDTVGIDGMENPFTPRRDGNRLFGRGAQDMKGSLAACMAAMQALVKSGAALAGDVVLAAVADEEYASLGTSDLIKHFRTDAAIVTEPTDLGLCLAHKGFLWFEIEITGRAAHGSRYLEGIDANLHMGRVLVALEEMASSFLSRTPHPLVGLPSLHASQVHGGLEWSTYAARSVLQLERRTVPGETEPMVRAEIQALLDRLAHIDPQFQASLKTIAIREPFTTTTDAPIVQAMQQAARTAWGREADLTGFSGWMDAALLAEVGIDTAIMGPIGEGLHTEVEWVDLNSVRDLAAILAQTAVNYCAA